MSKVDQQMDDNLKGSMLLLGRACLNNLILDESARDWLSLGKLDGFPSENDHDWKIV